MAKIATVNVVTLFGGIVDNIVSFSDNKRGNRAAEKLFTTKLEEHGLTDEEDVSDAIENGHYEVSMGKEEYFLVHSS
jgi:hypothetical protein